MNDANLVWIDLEMSGLDPRQDKILEVACMITNWNLESQVEPMSLVVNHPISLLEDMDDWNQQHHKGSGLWEKVINSTFQNPDVEKQVLQYIKQAVPVAGEAILAGNSLHMDRMFLTLQMPNIVAHLHHRVIDVSTVKELSLHWYPDIPEYEKNDTHNALDDVFESIEELKYYRSKVFLA